MKKISVVGFGKIGQAITANILEHGLSVVAIDINPALGGVFKSGSYRSGEAGLEEVLQPKFSEGKLSVSSDFTSAEGSEAIIVCIPLLVDKQKNILEEPFLSCFDRLSAQLKNKVLLVVETSIPVGFARNRIAERLAKSGKKHGVDYLLVHSPERIKSGTMMKQLLSTPKVIGGLTGEAAQKGYEVYSLFFRKELLKKVNSIETAEMIKLAGMSYRDINIAVSNQLAQFAHRAGIDYGEVLAHTNTDGEAHLLQPGIGVGGHCTPVYPYFLINNFKEYGLDFTLAGESRIVNDRMASYAVSLLADKHLSEKSAVILGLGFRPDVKEDTFSTAYLLKESLTGAGFSVKLCDSLYTGDELRSKGFEPAEDLYSAGAEAAFLVTAHTEFRNADWKKLYASGLRYLVDGRYALPGKKIEESGIKYIPVG